MKKQELKDQIEKMYRYILEMKKGYKQQLFDKDQEILRLRRMLKNG